MQDASTRPSECAVFCRVIDNFGDAAVAWRIARILANEHAHSVDLYIDRIDLLRSLLQTDLVAGSSVEKVRVLEFDDAAPSTATLLVETFGCGLPEGFLTRRRPGSKRVALINIEYLSAEDWVESVHGLSSPARDGLPERHFLFPGFTSGTAGILRERGLARQRREFLQDQGKQHDFLASLSLVERQPDAAKLSWFSYSQGFTEDFFSLLAETPGPALHLILAEGVMTQAVKHFCGSAEIGASHVEQGLQVSVVPFLAQPDYDRLLLCCDANLARGEDSFVRAQLAGRPLLWDIYPQEEDAHELKLEAFLARYCMGWSAEDEQVQSCAAFALIQRGANFPLTLRNYCAHLASLRGNALKWVEVLEGLPELGAELAKFAQRLLK